MPSTTNVANWYHDVAVRLAPTAKMVAAIHGARVAAPFWAAGDIPAWEQSCFPFLRHLLSPTVMLVDDDQLHPMLRATRLFLTTLDVDVTDLPDAADFGPVPALPFLHGSLPGGFTPLSLDETFWENVALSPPPVPQVMPGHEAEAPWVRLNRRRGRHGTVLD